MIWLASVAWGCMWDRDTLATEAAGLPGVLEVVTGRFDRNPPSFYEMRLARVSAEIAANPDALELYDDAAVAADRLGRSSEAIAWMAKKEARPGQTDESRYRTLANRGTFRAHAWMKSRSDGLLEQGRADIAAAITLNPDAHFGREHYQLRAMDWLLAAKPYGGHELGSFMPDRGGDREGMDPAEAVTGLTGLIVLGAAWQSVDVHWALARTLTLTDDGSLAELAVLRAHELAATRGSLQPGAPTGRALIAAIPHTYTLTESKQEGVAEDFAELRSFADAEHARRIAHMTPLLDAGKHPDTHSDFWNGFQPGEPPSLGGGWCGCSTLMVVAGPAWMIAAVATRRRRR